MTSDRRASTYVWPTTSVAHDAAARQFCCVAVHGHEDLSGLLDAVLVWLVITMVIHSRALIKSLFPCTLPFSKISPIPSHLANSTVVYTKSPPCVTLQQS